MLPFPHLVPELFRKHKQTIDSGDSISIWSANRSGKKNLNIQAQPSTEEGNSTKKVAKLYQLSGGQNLMTIGLYSYTPFAKPFATIIFAFAIVSGHHHLSHDFRSYWVSRDNWVYP